MFEGLNINNRCAVQIENCIQSGTLSHAVILEGSDVNTRLLAAKQIAKALVCSGEKKPCGNCRSCKKVEAESHPDIFFLEKGSDSSMIKVDAIRDLKEKAMLFPNDGTKSVFIIHEAQFMNPQAQNALLKIFEEPAQHVCFILTCSAKSAFLETITSRATSYYLSNEEYCAVDDSGFEKAKPVVDELITALCSKSELDFLTKTAVFQKDKVLFKNVLSMFIPVFRDALINTSPMSDCRESADLLRRSFTPKKIFAFIEITNQLLEGIERSANHNLAITRLCSAFYNIKTEQN